MSKLSSSAQIFSETMSPWLSDIRAKVRTKGITKEGDFNTASTTNVRLISEKELRRGRKHLQNSKKMLLDPTPSDTLAPHPSLTTEES